MTHDDNASKTSPSDASAERHLSVKDLAEREGVPVQTVYQWNFNQTGPVPMKIGRYVRYRMADVVAWEKSRLAEWGRVA